MYKTDLMPICANRTGEKLKGVKGVVIHYVAAAGGRASAVRNNFIKWAAQDYYASCHDIVDINGDVLHIIPYDEMAWHAGADTTYTALGNSLGYPNAWLIGIEMCHPDATGKPTEESRKATIDLCRDLLKQYGLTTNNLYLHNDITGKWCHKYYCDNPVEWGKFKAEVASGGVKVGNQYSYDDVVEKMIQDGVLSKTDKVCMQEWEKYFAGKESIVNKTDVRGAIVAYQKKVK